MIYNLYCDYGLGQSLIFLNYLRRVVLATPVRRQYCIAVRAQWLRALREVTQGLSGVTLISLGDAVPRSMRIELPTVGGRELVAALAAFSHTLELPAPVQTCADLWLEYPALHQPTPLSGPLQGFIANPPKDAPDLTPLLKKLVGRYRLVTTHRSGLPIPCAADYGLTPGQIGNVANGAAWHLLGGGEECWPTFNVNSRDKLRFMVPALAWSVFEPPSGNNTRICMDVAGLTQVMATEGVL